MILGQTVYMLRKAQESELLKNVSGFLFYSRDDRGTYSPKYCKNE